MLHFPRQGDHTHCDPWDVLLSLVAGHFGDASDTANAELARLEKDERMLWLPTPWLDGRLSDRFCRRSDTFRTL